ncbi:glutamate receptor-like [Portunus trituberculatus]|uniref:glutamate receptor-like n=1 Tax=Portunus trituberculatus TaxID=210409 RepID=UPI001E1CE6FB|nr:glutamate receptor-like [Portunus trituberculatus]
MKYFLDEFCRVLEVSYEILRPSDRMWGIMLPNGTYNGMVGMLLREEVDFALGPFFLSDSREKVADFTASFYYDSYYIVSQRPIASSDPSGIIKTFHPQVWLLVAVCMAVVGVVMMAMMWLTERLPGNGDRLVCPTSWLPENASGRLMVTVWVLSSLVIASVYRGNVTAMLTLPKIAVPIDSITDLTKQNRLPWKLEHGGLENFLLKSKDKAMQKMGTEYSGFIPSCWSARREILAGEFATACDKTSTMTMMAWDFRNL